MLQRGCAVAFVPILVISDFARFFNLFFVFSSFTRGGFNTRHRHTSNQERSGFDCLEFTMVRPLPGTRGLSSLYQQSKHYYLRVLEKNDCDESRCGLMCESMCESIELRVDGDEDSVLVGQRQYLILQCGIVCIAELCLNC